MRSKGFQFAPNYETEAVIEAADVHAQETLRMALDEWETDGGGAAPGRKDFDWLETRVVWPQ